MTTPAELFTALKEVTSDVAYWQFKTAVDPPFICYRFTGSQDVMADDANYLPIGGYDVELYTAKKDPVLEEVLEAALMGLDLTWTKTETPIPSESLLEVAYSVQLVASSADESS